MEPPRRDPAARSRRWFLFSLPAAATFAELKGKGRIFPSAIFQYLDPATEFRVYRFTAPEHTSLLSAYYHRAISRHGNFLIFSSDTTGRFEAFRLDLRNGQTRQLTEAENLDSSSLTLSPDERSFFYFDGPSLIASTLSSLHTREIYRVPEGFERGPGWSLSEDGQNAAIVEKSGSHYRLQLVHTVNGESTTLIECDEELRDPIPRPRRASILYRRSGDAWLVNYDAQQNHRLKFADGENGPALWSSDGHSILYLNYPADRGKLHNIREFTPDSNEEKMIAPTSQFVSFTPNANDSVFAGASGSKASPYVLLLVRAVKREFTLAEHRSSNPQIVAPFFSANSQKVFFGSDRHGKPAIYGLSVAKLVSETDA